MALLTSISDANKDVITERRVKYAAEPYVQRVGDSAKVIYWTLTRTSQMSYRYLALTRSAAVTGAASLVSQYTRPYERWTAEVDDATATPIIAKTTSLECTTDVTPSQAAGDAWEIEVNVNDTDTVIVTEQPETYADMEKLFEMAISREDADDGNAAITITEGHWDSAAGKVYLFWTVANIDSFSAALVVVQKKQGSNWVAVTVASTDIGAGGCSFNYAQNGRFRVSYNSGAVVSNEYVTTDEPMPALTLLGSGYTYSPSAVSDAGVLMLSVDIQATGSARALASLTIRNRWTIRVNDVAVERSYTSIAQISPGVYRVRFAVAYPYSSPPNFAVQLVFNSADESALSVAVSTTFTPANYVGEQWCKVVSTQPGAVRAMAYLETDLTAADLAAAFKAEQLYTQPSGQVGVSATYTATNVQLVELTATTAALRRFYIYGDFPIPYQGTMYSLAFSASLGGVKSNRLTVQFSTSPLYISAADADGLTFAFEGPASYVVDSAVKVYAYGDGTGSDSAAEVAVASHSGKTITFAAAQTNQRLRVYGCNDPDGIPQHSYTSPWACNSTSTAYFQLIEATRTTRPDGAPEIRNPLYIVFDRVIPSGVSVSSVEWLGYDGSDWTTITTQTTYEDGIATLSDATATKVRAVFTLSDTSTITTNVVTIS